MALKPMNCPGHMLLFGERLRSYKDLPMRFAESSTLHRDELGGTLHGLLRVKHVTQDDAHLFCSPDQIEDEIFGCLDYAAYLYDLFGMEAKFELSTRPEKKLGTDEEWDFTEGALKAALERRGIEYSVNEGDGAFYGPKIDLHMLDALGRSWQMGTIQLDAQMPQRFGLSLHGRRQQGALSRTSSTAPSSARSSGSSASSSSTTRGAFPFWLAPVQIRVLPVGEGHREAARALAASLEPYRVEVDDSDDTVGKRIRNAELEKIPFVVVYGDKESDEALAIREHGGGQSTLSLAEFRRNTCYPESLASRGETVSHLLAHATGVQPMAQESRLCEIPRRCMPAVFVVPKGGQHELGEEHLRPRRRSGFEPPRRPEPQTRINDAIRVPKVRLIGENGEQLGIKTTDDAREYAYGKNLDLVEVAAQADPPVARVMDYGKYRYELEQKAKLARKHQTQINVKEIKLRPKIGIHDYETKKGHVARFLNQRAKVKVTIMFRGREREHPDRGRDLLMRLADDVKEIGLDRDPAAPRRAEHDDGARPDEERRSEKRCPSRRHTRERRRSSR